ncbi:acetate/propionate family kinase [Belnapia rosea]|uniref:Acetate kinase n=1 Tax=Belnapia rosea TaxID=938405 RepID=A0A1G6W741_9PROT|nr:acetate/propionate family kinase [Belnapia rosea]SDD61533.1 acetate kinase [Belnapia rosea]
MTGRTILVLNAGSSSIKFQLYDATAEGRLTRRFKGRLEGIGSARPRLLAWDGAGAVLEDRGFRPEEADEVEEAQAAIGGWLVGAMGGPPDAIGHRVVHGGADYTAPVLADAAVLAALEALSPLAPLHQPHNLAPIRSILRRRPELPQVACFDTAFHATMPDLARRFAIPEALHARGIRRYGFHGLSYEYIAGRLPEVAPEIARGRVIVAHLGSGCSACAMVDGRSVQSTMGFSALDGLPMGTRPGQLDAGVVLHLCRDGMGAAAIEHLLYHRCGLLGLSGISADVRELLASPAPGARLALDYFADRTAQAFGALAAAMGGLDGIVFTAGVGENAAPVRAMIAARCAWLGVVLDEARNAAHAPRISADGSRLPVHVIPTDEEGMVARHVVEVLRREGRWA